MLFSTLAAYKGLSHKYVYTNTYGRQVLASSVKSEAASPPTGHGRLASLRPRARSTSSPPQPGHHGGTPAADGLLASASRIRGEQGVLEYSRMAFWVCLCIPYPAMTLVSRQQHAFQVTKNPWQYLCSQDIHESVSNGGCLHNLG